MNKKEKIIQSSMKLFGTNGYDKTSIEEIVKDAQVSKGLLFHYFNNKEELYMVLYEMAYQLLENEVMTKINRHHEDLFELIKEAERLKGQIMKVYPYVFDFVKKAYYETNSDIASRIQLINEKHLESVEYTNIFQHLNLDKLRSGITFNEAMSMILWLAEGYMKNLGENTEIDTLIKDFDRYLEILKWGLYKEEYLDGNR